MEHRAGGSADLSASGAALPSQIPLLSAAPLGAGVAEGWRHERLPKVERANDFTIVIAPNIDPAADGATGTANSADVAVSSAPSLAPSAPAGATRLPHVLRVRSSGATLSWVARVDIDASATPWLQWRWRVSRALDGSDVRSKAGDDYAARLYVLFDLSLDQLSFGDRLKIQAARAISGVDVPAAAICYVWGGSAQPAGSSAWNPYTNRVRMIVVDSPRGSVAGTWRNHARDVRQDWASAFGGRMPRVAAVAVGADTDNTGESVETWFDDLRFSATAEAAATATTMSTAAVAAPANPNPGRRPASASFGKVGTAASASSATPSSASLRARTGV